jgi:D-threo-aldose 1-dehydrogenase
VREVKEWHAVAVAAMADPGAGGQDAGMATSSSAVPRAAVPRQPGAVDAAGRLVLPPVIFGISALGNLYRAIPDPDKDAIVAACRAATDGPAVFDGAGKYGAGLALEALGRALRQDGADPAAVLLSNKLGWRRAPLVGPEPTFEPGAWVGISHDAVQDISDEGILRCWEEGDRLLGAPYRAALVSVHDPDEYLAAAPDEAGRQARLEDVVGAYRALDQLRSRGLVRAVGIGAKDWRVARAIAERVRLDWVMLACSLTVRSHPRELVAWVAELDRAGIAVIDSALFHGGFLTGGSFYDYRRVDPASAEGAALIAWRERFSALCARHGVAPAHACVQFALSIPGVRSVALNTADPARAGANVALATVPVPAALWRDCADAGLIERGLELAP